MQSVLIKLIIYPIGKRILCVQMHRYGNEARLFKFMAGDEIRIMFTYLR